MWCRCKKGSTNRTIDIHFRYPLVNDGIEYKTNKDSKMKWDRWGNSYRIKKGDQVVSLSDLQSSTLCVGKPYSTVVVCSLEVLLFQKKVLR